MSLNEQQYLGDWLKEEFCMNYCREEVTVLVDADRPSGQVLGVESVFSKYAPYDNSNPAAASAVLIEAQALAEAKTVTSIVDLVNTATVTTTSPHGLVTGDIVKISGATVDTDLNGNYSVTVSSTTVFTVTSASVSDATYTEATLRVTKLNRKASVLKRGPAIISSSGLNWGASDGTGITAGLADLAALTPPIIAREGV